MILIFIDECFLSFSLSENYSDFYSTQNIFSIANPNIIHKYSKLFLADSQLIDL